MAERFEQMDKIEGLNVSWPALKPISQLERLDEHLLHHELTQLLEAHISQLVERRGNGWRVTSAKCQIESSSYLCRRLIR